MQGTTPAEPQTPETAPETSDPIVRRHPGVAVLRMGLPLALGFASHVLINLVDLVMVGRLGADAVQAAHVASTWNFLPMIVGNCLSTALLARLSRRLGLLEHDAARALHARAEWFMVWFGLATALASTLPAGLMVAATGLTGSTAADATHYLVVSNLGCVPMFVLMQTTAAMRAAGEVLVPLALLLLANVVNLVLNLVLMFGFEPLGVPAFGVVGAAYAAVAGRAGAAVLGVAWLCTRDHPLSLRAVPRVAPEPVVRPLLGDAWPQIAQIGLRAGLVIVLTVVVQRQCGDGATAALGIATRLDTLILFASIGFANAATVYAGRAVVVGLGRRARAAGVWAAVQAAALGVGAIVLVQRWPEEVVALFLPAAPPAVVEIARVYFGVGLWSQALAALALAAMGAVHGAGRMVAPLVLDVVGFAVAYGLLLVAGPHGFAAVCAALVWGMAIVAVLHLGFAVIGGWTAPVGSGAGALSE